MRRPVLLYAQYYNTPDVYVKTIIVDFSVKADGPRPDGGLFVLALSLPRHRVLEPPAHSSQRANAPEPS